MPAWNWINHYAEALLLVVAIAAAIVGFFQLREASRLRREQAQPYVAIDMRLVDKVNRGIELVVKNFGSTAAHDINFESNPPLVSASTWSDGWEFRLPTVLPTLVPQQEWTTKWEQDAAVRIQSDLPLAHDIKITYKDSQGRILTNNFRLDWAAHAHRIFTVQKGTHQVAQELGGIKKSLDRLTGPNRRAVLVQIKDESTDQTLAKGLTPTARLEQIYRRLFSGLGGAR